MSYSIVLAFSILDGPQVLGGIFREFDMFNHPALAVVVISPKAWLAAIYLHEKIISPQLQTNLTRHCKAWKCKVCLANCREKLSVPGILLVFWMLLTLIGISMPSWFEFRWNRLSLERGRFKRTSHCVSKAIAMWSKVSMTPTRALRNLGGKNESTTKVSSRLRASAITPTPQTNLWTCFMQRLSLVRAHEEVLPLYTW